MSVNEVRSSDTTHRASPVTVDMKLEVVVIPVLDVDRAKEFYARLGWRLDADRVIGDNFRLVHFTPPGSGASIQFDVNLTPAIPGSARAMLLIVSDIEAARRQLAAQGIETTEVFHCESVTSCRFPGIGARVSGPQTERLSYQSFVSIQHPDGNGWVLQEVTRRLAGRVAGNTRFTSVQDLAQAMLSSKVLHIDLREIRGRGDSCQLLFVAKCNDWVDS
jgi:catechol 2,3-dioxygenase-like lactoylglutathione lyase family enzyme